MFDECEQEMQTDIEAADEDVKKACRVLLNAFVRSRDRGKKPLIAPISES